MADGDLSLRVVTPAYDDQTAGTVLLADADTATFEEGTPGAVLDGHLVALVPLGVIFTYGGDDDPAATYAGAGTFTYNGAPPATYGGAGAVTYGGDDDPTTTYGG